MRHVLGWKAMAVFGLASMMAAGSSWQDESSDAEKALAGRRSEQFKESLGWYNVYSPRDPKEPMKPEIVLRWSNPVRLQKGETALVMWADAGRPEALASIYPWTGNLVYECISMAREKGLTAKEGERTIWTPDPVGVTFRDVPDAPAPAKTATARLAQMKAMAEPFKVTMFSWKAGAQEREEMRLLPKPIYRYDLANSKSIHPNLVDGALFAFAMGTDPEAVLIFEAVQQGDKSTWRYAFARATGYTAEARLGNSVVWTAPNLRFNDPRSPGLAVGRPLVD